MSTYTFKNAIVDLGFIDACCYFGGLSMNDDIKELLFNSLEAVEKYVMDGRLSGNAIDPHRNAKMLHHLGWIRGVLWIVPVPTSLSEAIDRVINFATGTEDFALDLTDDYHPEPKERWLSMNQRDVTLQTGGNGDDAWSAEFARSLGASHVGVLDVWRRLGVLNEAEIEEELAKGTAAKDQPVVRPDAGEDDDRLKQPASEVAEPQPSDSIDLRQSAWTPERRAAQAERARNQPPLVPDSSLEAVKADWESGMPFDRIGSKHGCSGGHIRNFLKKHGINPNRGRPGSTKPANVGPAAGEPVSPAEEGGTTTGVCVVNVKPDVFEMLTGRVQSGGTDQGEALAPLH